MSFTSSCRCWSPSSSVPLGSSIRSGRSLLPGCIGVRSAGLLPLSSALPDLFISGGLFAYFVAFRFGLEFLLGLGINVNVTPVVSINEYFDLFVNVTLGVGLVFEMPVIIFFLTLLRMASPRFLLKHSRYAILAITILAAIVTPTPDVFNMMIFAVPMVALYFVGLFASYLFGSKARRQEVPMGNYDPRVCGYHCHCCRRRGCVDFVLSLPLHTKMALLD